jgi:DNA-binding LacI/PurR family transcriptional regulator
VYRYTRRDAHVDGFARWTTVADDPMLDIISATGKPACIQGDPERPGIEFVGIDDAAAAHVIGTIGLTGARRPAIISFPRDRDRIAEIILGPEPEKATFPVTAARLAGYRRAVVEYGLGWEKIPVAFVPTNACAEGAAAARTSLDEYGADAILCTSDNLVVRDSTR